MRLSVHFLHVMSIFSHLLQCFSAAVVMGITAWAVKVARSVTVIYSLIIAALTIIVFLATVTGAGCKPSHPFPFVISVIFSILLSFLWISSFVLLANDFNRVGCRRSRWRPYLVCGRQHTAEAFSFITFFFTLSSAVLDYLLVYACSRDQRQEKYDPTEASTTEKAIEDNHISQTPADTRQDKQQNPVQQI